MEGFIAHLTIRITKKLRTPYMKLQGIQLTDNFPYDSPETQQQYYLDRIKLLEEELSGLNLLEHPCEILAICKQIISIKQQLPNGTPQMK